MGRLVAFIAHIYNDGDHKVRGIGIDERSVVLLEPDGKAKVVGQGDGAYLLKTAQEPQFKHEPHARTMTVPREISAGRPLRFWVDVQHVRVGSTINWKSWNSPRAERYTLRAEDGKLTSSKADAKPY
jgi:hypothetical protein